MGASTKSLAADVLVLGGGMSGLCAALAAAEQGARVLVLEKGNRFGGSMALSNGIVWSFSRSEDVRERLAEGDAALQDLVVEQLPSGLDWLVAHGVQLQPTQYYFGYGHGRPASGPQMAAALCDAIRARGGVLVSSAGVQQLLVRDGDVIGARAFGAEGVIEATSRSVVLATGGFQGNAELLARHVSPHAEHMYLRANPWSTGDGLLAALDAGAATTSALDTFYGHAMTAPPARFGADRFQEMSHKYGPMAVAINLHGRRFADESAGTGEETLNIAIARQQDATAAYVFDAATADRPYEAGPLARVIVERARQAGGPVVQADTLEALAARMQEWGFPPREVLRTLREFNAAMEAGEGALLHPPRRGEPYAVTKPPFTAALVRAAITFTCGGLSVDLDMRVLRRAASVSMLPLVKAPADELQVSAIPGLFAAGCDIGGVSGRSYMGGLAQALVTGRVAGTQAAR
ncbi:FAD-dependent oxidoreductase [Ramlibacter sp. USB13]|uniref:FAD-dependent oxidoreductase n=1 Tax=Ramlibacter cellulosilyticus TaxID=2764187 RepID=A0A923MMH1_9BURK|nr:FAD-dependent oxidoreductase [Ramlibacter cellulosilyticus]MBC5782342.1 FAD-dependent oxidoreductase [Ramlibacter cellulosilyticus]